METTSKSNKRSFLTFAAFAAFATFSFSAEQPSAETQVTPAATLSTASSLSVKRAEMLRKVTDDPAVKAAWEKVESAQLAYQQAVQAALKNGGFGEREIEQAMGIIRAGGVHSSPFIALSSQGTLGNVESKRLLDARIKALQSPELEAAKKRKDSARTAEELSLANRDYQKMLKTEILKLDPGLEEALTKANEQ